MVTSTRWRPPGLGAVSTSLVSSTSCPAQCRNAGARPTHRSDANQEARRRYAEKVALLRSLLVTVVLGSLVACTGDKDGAGRTPPSTAKDAATTTTAAPHGVVSGRLIMVGGPAFTEPIPVGGTIEAHAGEDFSSQPIGVGTADDFGRFQMSLPPGPYNLSGRSQKFGGSRLPCMANGQVTVVAGASIEADVFCQIRCGSHDAG